LVSVFGLSERLIQKVKWPSESVRHELPLREKRHYLPASRVTGQ